MAKHKQSALVESTPLKKRRRRTQQQSNSSQLLNSNSKTPSSSSSLNSPRGAVDVEAREARNMRKKKDKEWAAALKKIWQSNLLLEELGEKQGFWKHLDPNTRQKNYLLRFDSTQILKKWGKEFDRRGIDEIKVESFVIARDKLEKKIRKQTAQSALRIFPEKYARKLKEAFDKFPTNYQMFFKETLTVNVASAVIKEFYEQSQAGTNRLNQPTQDDNLVALSNDRSLANGQPLEIREDAQEELGVEENGEFAQDDMAPAENGGAAHEYQDVDVDEVQEIDNEIVQVEEIEDIDDDIQIIDPPPRRIFVAPIMPREQDMIPYGGYSPEELAPPVVEMDDEPPPVIQINRGFWHDDEEDLGVQGREDAQEELDVEENGEFAHDDMVLVENGGAAQGHQDVDVDEVQEIDDEVVQVEEIEDIDDDIQVIEPPPRQPVVIAPTMRLAPDVIPYGGYQPRELEQPPMEIDDRRFPVIQMDRGFGHDDDVEIVEEIRQDVPRRKEDVSPARHRSPSLVRYRTPSPARNMSPPVRTLTPSPTSAGQSTSSDASRTPSPICRRTRAQVRAPNPPPTRAGLSAAAQNNNGYTMAVNKQKCRLVVIPNKFINESPSDYDVIRQVSSMEYKQSQKGVGKQTHNEETHLYCVTCGKYFFPYCSEHPALFIQDSPILIKQVGVPRAIASIPAGFFSVRDSSIVGAGLGVFAERMIPKGYMFGPYEGVRINDGPEARKGAYAYHLKTKTDSYLIDAADAEKSNWMRYVNTPSGDAEQNLVAIQFNGNIYFKVIRPILPGQEAFVEYGEGYHLSFFSGS